MPKEKKWEQCPSVLMTQRGRVWCFCLKRRGHKGHHRGAGAQWNEKHERVLISEELPCR